MSTDDQTTQEHLSREQIDLCADALAMEEFSRITPAVRSHLDQCEHCREEVEARAQEVRKHFSQSLSSALMEVKQPKAKGSWWIGVVAALLLLLGLGYLFKDQLFFSSDQIAHSNDTLTADSISFSATDTTQALINDSTSIPTDTTHSFQNNPELEALVQQYQNGASQQGEFEISTPAIYTAQLGQVTLEWKGPATSYLNVELYNHKNEKLESVVSSSGKMTPKEIKKEGHYYWKLSKDNGHLLFCGKIIATE